MCRTSTDHQINKSANLRVGGAERIRTADPLLAKQMLSQLSYSPNGCEGNVRRAEGRTNRRGDPQLVRWWAWIELNYRPRAYQARALTN